jgi:hypothetical protein
MHVLAVIVSRGDFKATCAASSNAKVSRDNERDLQQTGDRYARNVPDPLQSFVSGCVLLLTLLRCQPNTAPIQYNR